MRTLLELIRRYRTCDDDVEDVTPSPRIGTVNKKVKYIFAKTGKSDNNDEVGNGAINVAPEKLISEETDTEGNPLTYELFPIFIPSKGRYDQKNGTYSLLSANRVPFTLVVEPHEAEQYSTLLTSLPNFDPATHRIAVLPKSHQGISYVRNKILRDFSPSTGWFWTIDDDVRAFFRGQDSKNVEITPRALFQTVYHRMKKYPNASMFSLEYDQFCYNASDDDYAINSYNNIAVLFKIDDIAGDIEYRFKIREDYDFSLQMILSGKETVRFRNLSFRVPKMSTCSGGMTDYYTDQKDDIREQNALFLDKWPSVSRETIKGKGTEARFDVRVQWLRLNPKRCIGTTPTEILKDRRVLNPLALDLKKLAKMEAADPDDDDYSASKDKLLKVTGPKRARGAGTKTKTSLKNRRTTRRREESFSEEETEEEDSSISESNDDDDDDAWGEEDSLDEAAIESLLDEYNPRKPKKIVITEIPDKEDTNRTSSRKKSSKTNIKVNAIHTSIDKTISTSHGKKGPSRTPKENVKHIHSDPNNSKQQQHEKSARDWEGYGVVLYRELTEEVEKEIGLIPFSPHQISIGITCLFVPTLLSTRPSVMSGTVVGIFNEGYQVVPGRKYRGVDIQMCKTVYSPLTALCGSDGDKDAIEVMAKVLDDLIDTPPVQDCSPRVTMGNVNMFMEQITSQKKHH